jgi:DNA-binding response OmpR family regulator
MMPKILVIDDDAHMRTVLQFRLEKEDYQVFIAGDGAQGIRDAEREHPDLIVLDLVMPNLDGIEVLEQLRQSVVTWNTPVFVLTAHPDPEMRAQSHRLGAARFLQKPFSPRFLVSEISRVLDGADMLTRTTL